MSDFRDEPRFLLLGSAVVSRVVCALLAVFVLTLFAAGSRRHRRRIQIRLLGARRPSGRSWRCRCGSQVVNIVVMKFVREIEISVLEAQHYLR